MKKLMMIFMALCMIMPCAMADNMKEIQKQVNQKAKEFKKGKWEIFGSANTLEAALKKHYMDLNDPDGQAFEVSGVANNFKSKNLGKQACFHNACLTYSQSEGSDVKAKLVTEGLMASENTDLEMEHFLAAYSSNLEKEIRGEIKESFSVIRTLPNGNYEMQTFFVVNQKKASNARQTALQNALNEGSIAADHAKKISDYLNSK